MLPKINLHSAFDGWANTLFVVYLYVSNCCSGCYCKWTGHCLLPYRWTRSNGASKAFALVSRGMMRYAVNCWCKLYADTCLLQVQSNPAEQVNSRTNGHLAAGSLACVYLLAAGCNITALTAI